MEHKLFLSKPHRPSPPCNPDVHRPTFLALGAPTLVWTQMCPVSLCQSSALPHRSILGIFLKQLSAKLRAFRGHGWRGGRAGKKCSFAVVEMHNALCDEEGQGTSSTACLSGGGGVC